MTAKWSNLYHTRNIYPAEQKDASGLLFGKADIGVFGSFVVHHFFLFQIYKHPLNLMFHCRVQVSKIKYYHVPKRLWLIQLRW